MAVYVTLRMIINWYTVHDALLILLSQIRRTLQKGWSQNISGKQIIRQNPSASGHWTKENSVYPFSLLSGDSHLWNVHKQSPIAELSSSSGLALDLQSCPHNKLFVSGYSAKTEREYTQLSHGLCLIGLELWIFLSRQDMDIWLNKGDDCILSV